MTGYQKNAIKFIPIANAFFDPTMPVLKDKFIADMGPELLPLHDYCSKNDIYSLTALYSTTL